MSVKDILDNYINTKNNLTSARASKWSNAQVWLNYEGKGILVNFCSQIQMTAGWKGSWYHDPFGQHNEGIGQVIIKAFKEQENYLTGKSSTSDLVKFTIGQDPNREKEFILSISNGGNVVPFSEKVNSTDITPAFLENKLELAFDKLYLSELR
jgi:hypothetical protein